MIGLVDDRRAVDIIYMNNSNKTFCILVHFDIFKVIS